MIIRQLGSWRMGENQQNDSIIENSQNTENCPGDLRRLAVTQTPVKKFFKKFEKTSANADLKSSNE